MESTKKKFHPISYLKEAKEELQKVSWPSKKDTVRYSMIIVVISILVALYFGVLDWVFTILFQWLISLAS